MEKEKIDLFDERDIAFIEARGSSLSDVQHQFSYFEKGFPPAQLERAATINDGVIAFTPDEVEALLTAYEVRISDKQLLKFVPASGAASRMFKDVFAYLEPDLSTEKASHAQQLLSNLHHYAFYADLKAAMLADGISIDEEIQQGNYRTILTYLLTDKGLNYGAKPKAVLQFHRYAEETRTALEEHLVEAAHYARNSAQACHLHFTISPQHRPLYDALLAQVQAKYEQRYGVKYCIDFSVQSPATDTLAATESNTPFRDKQGNLLFRPAGHGALIYNLNGITADLIFVKNIDNVCAESQLSDTITYKKALASYLLQLQKTIFEYVETLQALDVSDEKLSTIADFLNDTLKIRVDNPTRESLLSLLDRPLRVCGMVKNEGAPGGGPYFVKNAQGEERLQIVESSQMDLSSPEQARIVQHATHFNPVDMVCSFRTYDGRYYNLLDYVDPLTGFISSKSYEGKTLKAMELPGLWNGAMAQWITLFVEVPLSTFNPVKTMFDLENR